MIGASELGFIAWDDLDARDCLYLLGKATERMEELETPVPPDLPSLWETYERLTQEERDEAERYWANKSGRDRGNG